MTTLSAQESLDQHIEKMGTEIGECYHYCSQAVFDLSITWDQHETLFQNKERIDILNRCDGLLAWNIQRHFWDSVILGICRLTDKHSKKDKRAVLSFHRLYHFCRDKNISGLDGLMIRLDEQVRELRLARDKILAHNDYDVKTEKTAALPKGSRIEITQILRTFFRILSCVLYHFESSQLAMFPQGNNSAWRLLYFLHFGVEHVDNVKREARSGNWQKMKLIDAPSWMNLDSEENDRYKVELL